MNAKASETDPGTLSIRLLALLETISRRAKKEDVHRLRTTVRRLEVLLRTPPGKVAKALIRLRKKAGKVRDLDVHLGLLKPMLPPGDGRKARDSHSKDKLRNTLEKERDRQRSGLRELVKEYAPLLESRLPEIIEGRRERAVSIEDARRKARRARQIFLQKTRQVPENAQALHRLRIETKKLRYAMEPLQFCPEAAALAQKFKQVQDAIGEWHDWATLEQLAERYIGQDDELADMLRARANREYRKARRSAESAKNWMMKASASGTSQGPKLVSKPLLRKAG